MDDVEELQSANEIVTASAGASVVARQRRVQVVVEDVRAGDRARVTRAPLGHAELADLVAAARRIDLNEVLAARQRATGVVL